MAPEPNRVPVRGELQVSFHRDTATGPIQATPRFVLPDGTVLTDWDSVEVSDGKMLVLKPLSVDVNFVTTGSTGTASRPAANQPAGTTNPPAKK